MGNTLFHLQFPPPALPETSHINTLFESLDGWKQQLGLSASITLQELWVWLQTGTTTNAWARLYKAPGYLIRPHTFSKPRQFETKVELVSPANANPGFIIATGRHDLSFGFGFQLALRTLKGWAANGGAAAYATLETYGVGALDTIKKYKAIFTPASKVEFYVDDIKLGEVTTQLPDSTPGASCLIYLYAITNSAHNQELYCSEFNVLQEL